MTRNAEQQQQQPDQGSMRATNDQRTVDQVGLSYLAVPLLGSSNQVVLIMYADCREFNFFADNDRIRTVRDMCRSYCALLDYLQLEPLPNLRNFPIEKAAPFKGHPSIYPTIQEALDIEPPHFGKVRTFNYEAAA